MKLLDDLFGNTQESLKIGDSNYKPKWGVVEWLLLAVVVLFFATLIWVGLR